MYRAAQLTRLAEVRRYLLRLIEESRMDVQFDRERLDVIEFEEHAFIKLSLQFINNLTSFIISRRMNVIFICTQINTVTSFFFISITKL
eukprot:IDg22072t1